MRSAFRILMAFGCMAALHAEVNDLDALVGSYAGPASVTAAVVASGSATVKVTRLFSRENAGTIRIDGSVSSNGNSVPLQVELSFRDGRVKAESFLLGLQGAPVATREAQVRGSGETLRFRLQAAPGAEFNGAPVSGAMSYSLVLRDGQLMINGRGRVKNGDGAPQQVVIAIVAARIP